MRNLYIHKNLLSVWICKALLATSKSVPPLALTPEHRTTLTPSNLRPLRASEFDTYIGQPAPPDPAVPLPPVLTGQDHEVRKLFEQQSSTKAAGPDNVSTSTSKHCANELAPVFTDLWAPRLSFTAITDCNN